MVAVIVMETGITGRAVAEAARPIGLAVTPTTTVAAAVHRGAGSRVVTVFGHRIPAGTAVMRPGTAVVGAVGVMSRAVTGVGPVPLRNVGTMTTPTRLTVTG